MKDHTDHRLPGKISVFALDRKVRKIAIREASSPNPLADGDLPSYQRLLHTTLRDSWLESLAAIAGAKLTAINRDLENGERDRDQLLERVPVARENAKYMPKFKLDVTTQLAIVLAQVLGLATTWPFIQTLGWPFPIAALLAFALAAFEVAIAVLFGLSLHALVMDEPKTPFYLTVKQNRLFRACALLTGTVAFASVIVLAALRGHDNHQIVWVILGLGLVAFSAYGGAAINDSRFEQAAKRLEKELKAAQDRIVALQNAFRATTRATMATGRGLCGAASQIAQRTAAAFAKSYRRHNRGDGDDVVVPTLPQLSVPSDADLRARLLIEMYTVQHTNIDGGGGGFDDRDHEVVDGEPVDDDDYEPVSPLRPRRRGERAARRVLTTPERRSS